MKTPFTTIHCTGPSEPQALVLSRILDALLGVGQSGVSLIAIVGLLFWIHWAIIPLLLLSGLPAIFVRLHYTRKVHSWERSYTELQRQASYLSKVLTKNTHAQEIRVFDLGSLCSKANLMN